MCKVTMNMVADCVREAERYGLTDEQFYLDFEDFINELSVRDHNN